MARTFQHRRAWFDHYLSLVREGAAKGPPLKIGMLVHAADTLPFYELAGRMRYVYSAFGRMTDRTIPTPMKYGAGQTETTH
jgi:hypothetical protein